MKERLANDQGRASFICSVKSWTEMRERGLSVLLRAGKDHMQISFSFENKPFESACLLQYFYDCSAIEGSFARTKMSLSDFSFL